MHAPSYILDTWHKFDHYPMETLTKMWYFYQNTEKKQRDVALMEDHYKQYGITGNCFDLAIWLIDVFQKDGITAYPIGHDLHSEEAHAAVMALDEKGNRYLCDLGDQWIKPILMETQHADYTNESLSGFFPAANVQVFSTENQIEITYQRPNGKVSRQSYDPQPVNMEEFLLAAEFSQHTIDPKPLFECRIPYKAETAHWEFNDWEAYLSTSEGLFKEPSFKSIEEWATRINKVSGYDQQFLLTTLKGYQKLQG
ncbi:hypothetical protein GI584_16565 [Gracilibacillus salitolerans]|uniref:Uncharacterized protein n=1 Tax=Gracilibacillus salitolerans TaxID=2663022 RepID=A0A5Q2TN28_9BACI|nr:hypothetical protein [Gracilibacillus salitolerans]QGH35561.1 hypothetical protein GI584_16565 [Gracilibacillus salitolerans]